MKKTIILSAIVVTAAASLAWLSRTKSKKSKSEQKCTCQCDT